MIKPWNAAIFHIPINSVERAVDKAEATAWRLTRLDEIDAMIGAGLAEEKADLVLLPEFTIAYCEENLRGVCDGDGPEVDRLAAIAQKHGVFLCAMLYVNDHRFPGRYFNSTYLFDESGTMLSRYYRLMTNHSSSPHDFWQRYLDVVGLDGAFPVAKTRLGNLGIISSMEIMYPELARISMLRGAETMLHLTSHNQDGFVFMHQTRAYENMMYWLSANATGDPMSDTLIGAAAMNWQAKPLGRRSPSQPFVTRATIDIEQLRTARSTPLDDNYVNLLARLRTEMMRGHYDDLTIFPVDEYVDGHVYQTKITPETYPDGLDRGIANMRKAGLLPLAN
jgi:predicted amidohydrolase